MSSEDAAFQIYHGGKFNIETSNFKYDGGEIHKLECQPESVLENLVESLNVSLSEHRFWYKLPFESLSDLKIMCNGTDGFESMCRAAHYTKAVDIFMVKEDRDSDGDHNIADGDSDKENEEHLEGCNDEEGCDDLEGCAVEDDENIEGCDDLEGCAVEDEENIEGCDAEEDYDSEGTPPNSDCEVEEQRYIRYKKGSGEIRLGQVFDSIHEFKDAVVDYALNEGVNIKFSRWGPVKSEVKCSIGGNCKFRIYCSIDTEIGRYMVKTFHDEHACIKDGYSKVVKDGIIAKYFLNDIRKNPLLKPKEMQEKLEERYNLIVSNDQCRKAKAKALSMIQDEQDEQFARIKDYRLALIDSNPGSTVEVVTVKTDDGREKFDRIYVCLAPLRKSWLADCRPIIGIDGCFLKNNVKGQLLAAIGRDANNQFYPVAWCVVPVENADSWIWFIKLLKTDLNLEDGTGFAIISDRQKGLLLAVEQELPKVEHRMCARHIYGNLRRVYPGKSLPRNLFWAVVKSFNHAEYETAIKALKDFDKGVYEAVMMKNPRNCSRAFFTCTTMCEDVSNNFSESYNNTINKAREMPLVEMLETIRRQCMIRNAMRKKKATSHQGKFSLKVAKTIAEEEKQRMYCQVIPCGNGHYEVTEHGHAFRVDMNAKTCACRRWSMTGIPCRHVLRIIVQKKLKPEDFVVSDWYLTTRWVNQYSETLMGVNGLNFWRKSGESRIDPPPKETGKGPKKKQKRIKGKNESPQKKKNKKNKGKEAEEPLQKKQKLTRVGKSLHCGRCGLAGHNVLKCKNIGAPVKRPSKKRSEAGPSQVSQASQSQASQSQASQSQASQISLRD